MFTGDRAFDAIGCPVVLALAEKPALLAGDALVGQALVVDQFFRVSGHAMPGQVGGAGGDAKALGQRCVPACWSR